MTSSNIPVGFLRSPVNTETPTLVGPDEAEYVDFAFQNAVGVHIQGRNSVVAIVSPNACIVTQITAISPTSWPDTYNTIANVDRVMTEVEGLYDTYRGRLSGATAYLVFGHNRGLMLAPTQIDLMQRRLYQMGLPSEDHGYEVQPSTALPAAATFVITAKGTVSVYLEDELIN
ncbi:hypothetical protein CMQ_5165 [Grosmannia clavigera kw1407]|uniref:Uncharacterized protein n=1 Tax=Grosmannia clavigera (strain kw1407 / UAMH 11150) TaxID=655863 RepID=F0XB24_GROCL|nr:uncharacterized protein CMQ_5165 [Grosmannia clavigera kw1407]EFX04903.1 hypothetical protein CMQ_5165 [Grosmannia clavigera kw1407]